MDRTPDWLKDIDITILAVLFGMVLGLIFMSILKQISIWRGAGKMTKKIEDDRVRAVFADILVEGTYEARVKEPGEDGYLSTAVANEWLKKFGNILSIPDLIPRGEAMMKTTLQLKHLKEVMPPEIAATAPEKPVITGAEEVKKSILALLRKPPSLAA